MPDLSELDRLAGILLGRIAWTSVQTILLTAVLLLLVRLLPRLSAATRCLLWWLVGVQLVLGLCWHAPLELPLLAPADRTVAWHISAPARVAGADGQSISGAATAWRIEAAAADGAVPYAVLHWRVLLLALWLAGLLAQVPSLFRQWLRARGLRRAAEPLADAALRARCAQQARVLGLRRLPALRVSDAIASPQVGGLCRPVVLLPASQALSPAESAMALAHELAHLRRGDLWLGWLPALAQQLFFFHPLARWAMREYALEREAACDALALRHAAATPQDYGRLLLRLGVAHPLHAGLAGASSTFRHLKRRLALLQSAELRPRQRIGGWLLAASIALVGVLPYRVTASAGTLPEAVSPSIGGSWSIRAPAAGTLLITPPSSPPPPAAHFATASEGGIRFSARRIELGTHEGAYDGLALLDDDFTSIDAARSDLAAIRHLRDTGDAPLLWFRRGAGTYVIRDQALLARAKGIYAPVASSSHGWIALGPEHNELGRRQNQLNSERTRLAGQKTRLAASSGLARSSAAARPDLDAARVKLDTLEHELDRQQAELDGERAGLDQQRRGLLEARREVRRTAMQAMRKLFDTALATGQAQDAGRG